MSRVAIMQPYFFPYLGYFQLIASVEKFIVYDDVAFIKQGWINRNRILVDGSVHTFSIPIDDLSSFRLIKDTEVNGRLFPKWKSKFLKTIDMEYRKAPHFEAARSMIERAVSVESKSIARMAVESILEVSSYLGLTTRMILSSRGYKNEFLKGRDRVIDICKKESAESYINVPGGMELYTKEDFEREGIELKFIKPVLKPYSQFGKDFCPGLSMIDVLMFNSPETCRQLVREVELN
jgi:WbqC-like protein family